MDISRRTLLHPSITRPYCSVSCGVIIHTLGDEAKSTIAKVVHVEVPS